MRPVRAGEQKRRVPGAASRISTTQHGSTSALLSTASKLGNQQMQALALQLHAQQRTVKPLPQQQRDELEREAERASEAAVENRPRETPPAAPPAPPPADASTPSTPPSPPPPSEGDPLPSDARARFEARFGERFDDVRIHADAAAAREAELFGARAFTRGSHIYFAHPPDAQVAGNERLIAHELAHVAQQHHQPALAQQALLDDGDVVLEESFALAVHVEHELDEEAFLIELLRQHFNVQDPATARKIIAQQQLDLPGDFVVPKQSIKNGYHTLVLGETQVLQIEWAARDLGVKLASRADPLAQAPGQPQARLPSPGRDTPAADKPTAAGDNGTKKADTATTKASRRR